MRKYFSCGAASPGFRRLSRRRFGSVSAAPWGRSSNPRPALSRPGTQGQALVEFALTFLLLVVPIVLAAVLAVNWGGWLYAWIEVDNAARVGANYSALGTASIGSPTRPTNDYVNPLITRNLSSLPTTSCPPAGIDIFDSHVPENPADAYVTVSITCAYTPLIPGFGFPTLDVSRQAVMRVLE